MYFTSDYKLCHVEQIYDLQSAYLEGISAGVQFLTNSMCSHKSDTILPWNT